MAAASVGLDYWTGLDSIGMDWRCLAECGRGIAMGDADCGVGEQVGYDGLGMYSREGAFISVAGGVRVQWGRGRGSREHSWNPGGARGCCDERGSWLGERAAYRG